MTSPADPSITEAELPDPAEVRRPFNDPAVRAVMDVLNSIVVAREIGPSSHRPMQLPTDANAGYAYANRILDAIDSAAGFDIVRRPPPGEAVVLQSDGTLARLEEAVAARYGLYDDGEMGPLPALYRVVPPLAPPPPGEPGQPGLSEKDRAVMAEWRGWESSNQKRQRAYEVIDYLCDLIDRLVPSTPTDPEEDD